MLRGHGVVGVYIPRITSLFKVITRQARVQLGYTRTHLTNGHVTYVLNLPRNVLNPRLILNLMNISIILLSTTMYVTLLVLKFVVGCRFEVYEPSKTFINELYNYIWMN